MNNTSSKTPINISQQNIQGKCDLKCAYNFSYKDSNSTAKNNGVNISLTYDNSSVSPVSYNNEKYVVSKIMLFSPSLHLFDGATTDGEIIVDHTPELGGPHLFVCVPIIKSSETSSASILLTKIIISVASNAPSSGDSTNLNISGFTLQEIIPKKPFVNYSGDYNQSESEFIVYSKKFGIPINEKVLSTLGSIIKPFALPMFGNNLYMNSKGPNSGGSLGGGIYISCQPTGSSEEQINITDTKEDSSENIFDNETTKIIFQSIIGCLLFMCVFLAINYGFSMLSSNPVKMPNLKMQSFKKTE